jgi:hypothetical protein
MILDENKNYLVKSEGRGRKKCRLIQQTNFLFVFQPLEISNELDKRVICIAKVNCFLDRTLIKETI